MFAFNGLRFMRHGKSFPVILVLLSLSLTLLFPGIIAPLPSEVYAQEAFVIEHYSVDVTSHPDASFTFQETIRVRFSEPRHGIIRSIPRAQATYPYQISDIHVDGDPFNVETDSADLRIRIGDPDVFVDDVKEYVLYYRLTFPQDEDPDGDVAYLNLIGTGWDTSIESVDIRFFFPMNDKTPVLPMSYELYSGIHGSGDAGSAYGTIEDDHLSIRLSEPLSNYEGLSVLARFPENTFPLAVRRLYPYQMSDYSAQVVASKDKKVEVTETFRLVINDDSYPLYYRIPGTDQDGTYLKFRGISLNGNLVSEGGKLFTHDVLLTQDGEQTIRYTLVLPFDTPEDQRSLSLDLFSFYREVPLTDAQITVKTPFEVLEATAEFSGERGSEEPDPAIAREGLTLIFRPSSPLEPNEGVYLTMTYPEGSFGFVWGGSTVLLILGPLLLLLMALFLFMKYGKDKVVSPVIEFYPPDGLSSGAVGYAINRIVNPIDMTSMLVYWASHGHLSFTATGKKDFVVSFVSELDPLHPYWEQRAFDVLKGMLVVRNNVMTKKALEKEFYTVAQKMKSTIPVFFRNEKDLDDRVAKRFSGIAALLAFVWTFVFTGYVVFDGTMDRTLSLIGGAVAGVALLFLYTAIYFIAMGWHHRRPIANMGIATLASILTFIGIVIYSAFLTISEPVTPFLLISWNILLIVAAQFIAVFIHKRSDYGQLLLERILGFKEFLVHAEKERLEALLNSDPEYYYHILPYALVLNVSDIWENKFKNIRMDEPGWYQGSYPGHVFTVAALSSFARNTSTSMANHTAPPSSGSGGTGFSGGGGGFSGGGGGGGGGSSW
jgi:uncharacterized membrane protein YgcG